MPLIIINCPSTGQAVSTGMATDAVTWKGLADAWVGTSFRCPVCDRAHFWRKRDAHLARAVELHGIAAARNMIAGIPLPGRFYGTARAPRGVEPTPPG